MHRIDHPLAACALLGILTRRSYVSIFYFKPQTLAEMLSQRDAVSSEMQDSLDVGTDPWGVKVERVEM